MWKLGFAPERWVRWGLKPLIWLGLLFPAGLLVTGVINADLGADPQKTIVHTTGQWALYSLWLSLAVTPVRRLTGIGALLLVRRLLGLFAFFYACLHLTSYMLLYMGLDWPTLVEDLTERPYIIVGFLAFLGLLPLAWTSTRRQMRRLGRRWGRLHRLVYPVAGLAWLHYFWQTKSDLNQPVLFGLLLVFLLAVRIYWFWLARSSDAGLSRQVPATEK
ncbi:MAG TPA: protein-methionine-sulfoxide reductase heme-binding subunit MsrQ [Permianibacter sp.]|nr:protein-methionine-sulfoxide reductase heme-binding subunit MsrQ [Permianibacter sp.]